MANIENAAVNKSQINATVGEQADINIKTKGLRNIKVTNEYNEAEEEDKAQISKELKKNVIPQNSAQQQMMKQKILTMKLESDVNKNMNSEEFMSDDEYQIICTKISENDFKLFNKLQKNKKVEFLIKNYQNLSQASNKILNQILPYVDALTIKTSLKFYKPENLSTDKKIALISRLAPDATPEADDTLIALLLVSDENVVAGCSINTLMALRNKEYLGTKFFQQLAKQTQGKLTKAQHRQLAKLSAKITTICYAYYIEETMNAVTATVKQRRPINQNNLKLKGVKDEVKARLIEQLKAKNIIGKDGKTIGKIDRDSLKASIKDIVGDTLKMKEELAQKQKIAKMQQNISDIIGDTKKLKEEFESKKAKG